VTDEQRRDAAGLPDALPPLVIRPMRGTDIEQVSRVERRSFPTPWSTQAYVTEIANPSACYLVAALGERAETVVGYGGTWVIMDEAHITTLGVDPTVRGRKIGERLLCELLVAARRLGATRATLEVRESNTAAKNLYAKYGFAWVAQRKGYYTDNNENADILWINDMTTSDWRRVFNQNRKALGLPPV
jgi:ribosomal-protein-alanine N-acetyltransferase